MVDVSLPTVVIIHGWVATSNISWMVDLTDAYLNTSDYNVITVDWSPIANLDYISAVAEAKNVGKLK